MGINHNKPKNVCFVIGQQFILSNNLVELHQTSQEWSLGGPLSNIDFQSMQNSSCHDSHKEKKTLIYIILLNTTGLIQK